MDKESGDPIGGILDPLTGKPVQPDQVTSTPLLPNISQVTVSGDLGGLGAVPETETGFKDPSAPFVEEPTTSTPLTQESSPDKDGFFVEDLEICIPTIEAYTAIILDG